MLRTIPIPTPRSDREREECEAARMPEARERTKNKKGNAIGNEIKKNRFLDDSGVLDSQEANG